MLDSMAMTKATFVPSFHWLSGRASSGGAARRVKKLRFSQLRKVRAAQYARQIPRVFTPRASVSGLVKYHTLNFSVRAAPRRAAPRRASVSGP